MVKSVLKYSSQFDEIIERHVFIFKMFTESFDHMKKFPPYYKWVRIHKRHKGTLLKGNLGAMRRNHFL